jgi:hypothetical protein
MMSLPSRLARLWSRWVGFASRERVPDARCVVSVSPCSRVVALRTLMLEKGGLWFVEPRPDPRGSIPRGRRSLLACAIGSRHSVLQLRPPDQRSYELLHGKMRRETYITCSLLKRNTCSMCFMSLCGVSTTDWSPSLWCLGCTRAGSPIIVLKKN